VYLVETCALTEAPSPPASPAILGFSLQATRSSLRFTHTQVLDTLPCIVLPKCEVLPYALWQRFSWVE